MSIHVKVTSNPKLLRFSNLDRDFVTLTNPNPRTIKFSNAGQVSSFTINNKIVNSRLVPPIPGGTFDFFDGTDFDFFDGTDFDFVE